LLTEILGADFDIALLDSKRAGEIKKTLQELPKSRNKNPKTRDLPLKDALNMQGVEKLNVGTVNEYLGAYGSLFGWAEAQGHISKNPFKNLNIRQKKGKQKNREAFDLQQIKTILTALPEHTPEKSGKSFPYWGTMIAIYTGARLNEIAQLALSDIKQDKDVWYFDLNDEDDKQLKNANSKRRVPVHTALLSLGIIDRIQKLRTQKHTRLFPDLKFQQGHGYGRSLARWVNENFLVTLNIKAKGLSFHSFRHSFITNLRQSGVELQTVQELVGHDKGVVTEVSYNHGYDLQQLKAAIDKLKYNA